MGRIKKVTVTVDLAPHGFEGETLEIWVNFPKSVKDDLFELKGEENIHRFIEEKGIFCGTTLEPEDGMPATFKNLPWQVAEVATHATIEELTKRAIAIQRPPSKASEGEQG